MSHPTFVGRFNGDVPEAYGNLSKAPNSCTHTGWTEERVKLVTELWTSGLSASQCAAKLGGVTRNAVIGKVTRLGLAERARRPVSTPGPRTTKLKITNTGGARRVAAIRRPIVQPPEPVAPYDATFSRPWLERGSRQCAFPVTGSGADVWSCCAPTAEKATYCGAHAAVMFNPQPTMKKTLRIGRLAA